MISPVIQAGTNETWAPAGATFVYVRTLGRLACFLPACAAKLCIALVLDPNDPRKAQNLERHFPRQFGRLRDIVEGPDKALYLLTSNRDGRGSPAPDDDRSFA